MAVEVPKAAGQTVNLEPCEGGGGGAEGLASLVSGQRYVSPAVLLKAFAKAEINMRGCRACLVGPGG